MVTEVTATEREPTTIINTDKARDLGDGFSRWTLGVGQPQFLVTTVCEHTLAYVSGCHIKYLKVTTNPGRADVIRVFRPQVEGIGLLEGNPSVSTYAVAETTRKPRILIYKFEPREVNEGLVAELKGCAEFEYRAIRFTKKDLLLVLVGVPEFTVSVWSTKYYEFYALYQLGWAQEQELLVVNSLENEISSNLIVSSAFDNYWIEWSTNYITFYELQAFTENNVIRTEISLPPNQASPFQADQRHGAASEIDIISVTWTTIGEFFVLDNSRNLYKLNITDKTLMKIGPIRYEPNAEITGLFPYEAYLGVATSTGVFLILAADFNGVVLKGHLELSGNVAQFLPYMSGSRVLNNSFYAISKKDKLLDIVIEGKVRSSFVVTDFTNSDIQYAAFIEPDGTYLATVTDRGCVTIWEAETGAFFTKWKLPFKAMTVLSHPLIPYMAVGTTQGSVVFLDIRQLDNPKIIYRGYMSEDGAISRLAFLARGKFLLSGDANAGKIYLQYGLPTLEFLYLDHDDLPGRIWHINVPHHYRDLRLQILTKAVDEEVPSFLNNYRLNNEQLDLVASIAFDAPMTSLCFSPFKRLMYSYSCEGMGIGLIPYTEDMQAGSLKEPDLQFNFDFQLNQNRILVAANKFFSFSEAGIIMISQPPAPKNPETTVYHRIQTHFVGQGGIIDGLVSLDGTQLLAFGKDRTLVHIKLEEKPAKPDWELLGLGRDMNDVKTAQMRVFDKIQYEHDIEIRPDELTLVKKDEEELAEFNVRKFINETSAIEEGLGGIREEMRKLLQENESRPEEDKLDLDEFELDSDEDEILNDEFKKDRAIAEAVATSLIEERQEWTRRMKELVWDDFSVKGSRINGFEFSREISNYPLKPLTDDFSKQYRETVQYRKFERKVDALDEEINRIGAAASVNVLQIVLGMGNNNNIEQQNSAESLTTESKKNALDARAAANAIKKAIEQSMNADETAAPPQTANTEGPEELEDQEEEEDGEGQKDAFRSPENGGEEDALEDGKSDKSLGQKSVISIPTPEGVAKEVIIAYEAEMNESARESVQAFDTYDDYDDYGRYGDDEEEEEGGGGGTNRRKKMKKVVRTTESGEIETIEVEDETSDESGSDDDDYNYDTLNKVPMTIAKNQNPNLDRDWDTEEEMEESPERQNFLMNLYSGSLLFQFIQPNSLLHDQLELSSRHHIRNQMILIETEIRRLKEYFNREYEEIRNVKDAEMKVIADRNRRIREITDYFGLNMDVIDPIWTDREDASNVFIVNDDEIPFERYYTDEEREEMERLRQEEEARRLAQQDDFRERALMVMMDGVLETRKEDVLRKDIPKPAFMMLKEEWEWNQEEFKQADEYNKRVAELDMARLEFKKELEGELRTVIRQNADSKQMIDDKIKQLWLLKVRVELCIRMEEIKLTRMVKQIMRRSQLDADEDRLSSMLKKLQDSMKSSQSLAAQLLTRVELCTKRYEEVVDCERTLERTFRRDLGEVGHFFDLFMRLHKKRPKLNLKNEKTTDVTNMMIRALNASNLRWFAQENGELGDKIASALLELDDPIQNPMGCPRSTWDRFCTLRRNKILCEYETRQIGTELLELKQALAECKSREDEVAMAMATVLASLSHQRDIKMANIHNFEFQMVLNQGQVELPLHACTRADFYNAVLLKKKFIEICNHFITKYGAVKLRAMNTGKIQHRQIKQLEWRYKYATLHKRNLLEKFHDINTIKATKEILTFIKQGRNFRKMQEARLQKIRELQAMADTFHKKFMGYQQTLLKLQDVQERITEDKNKQAGKLIFEQNLYVNECRLMCNLETTDEKDNHMKRRMQIIMQTGRMMRRIARNAEEVVLLENELDRQYRKTYPVL